MYERGWVDISETVVWDTLGWRLFRTPSQNLHLVESDAMTFRIATLNLEQDHKRWPERQALIVEQLRPVQVN